MGASASLSVPCAVTTPRTSCGGVATLKQCPHDVAVLITGLVALRIQFQQPGNPRLPWARALGVSSLVTEAGGPHVLLCIALGIFLGVLCGPPPEPTRVCLSAPSRRTLTDRAAGGCGVRLGAQASSSRSRRQNFEPQWEN